MPTFQELLKTAEQNLSSSDFIVSRNVSLSDNLITDMEATDLVMEGIAHKGQASPGGVFTPTPRELAILVRREVFVQHASAATEEDFYNLFDKGKSYASDKYGTTRWYQFPKITRWIFPCIVVDKAEPKLISFATGKPRISWTTSKFFPVLYDISTGKVHYFQGEPGILGMQSWPDMQSFAQSLFEVS